MHQEGIEQPASQQDSVSNPPSDLPATPQTGGRSQLAHVRHELRTPINAILGYSEMLLEDLEDADDLNLIPLLQVLQSCGNQILGQINHILNPDAPGFSGQLEAPGQTSAAFDFLYLQQSLERNLGQPIGQILQACESLLRRATTEAEEFVSDLNRIQSAAKTLQTLSRDVTQLLPALPPPNGVSDDSSDTADPASISTSTSVATRVANSPKTAGPGIIRPNLPVTVSPDTIPAAVLVVDDNVVNRDLLTRQLERQGYRVDTAANGRVALQMLKDRAYDAILLDILMPEMDGYEVLERLKQDEVWRHLPVIMISSLDEIASAVRCIELGAEDYLSKPFDPVLLRARLGASLEKKRLRDQEVIYLQQLSEANKALHKEKEKSEHLLLNILPQAIAEQLKQEQGLIARRFEEATILFSDIVSFTKLSSHLQPSELVDFLNQIFSTFDRLTGQYGLEKIKTIGDAYMVAGGLPEYQPDSAAAVAEMALAMQREIQQFKQKDGEPFQIRIGINTGPVVAGVIGLKKFVYDLWGDSVNIASRMESQGLPNRIQVTAATYHHLKDQYCFEPRGTISVKGKGEMATYWLTGRRS